MSEEMYAVFETHPINQQATLWVSREVAVRLRDHLIHVEENAHRTFLIMDMPMNRETFHKGRGVKVKDYLLPLRKEEEPMVYVVRETANHRPSLEY